METNDPVFILLKGPSFPLASEAKAMLGRIVKNFAQPLAEYKPEDASTYNKLEPNTTELSNAARIADVTSSKALKVKFLSIAEAFSSQENSQASVLKNSKISAWELRQQETVFQRLTKDPEILGQIKRWAKPKMDPAYMIVGLLIWQDAAMASVKAHTKRSEAAAKIPTGAAASAAIASTTGTPVSPEVIGDIEGQKGKTAESVTFREAQSNDSRIFAVQYRNVRGRSTGFLKTNTDIVLEDHGPRVEEDRMFGDNDAFVVTREDSEVLLEAKEVDWTNVLDELDEPARIAKDHISIETGDKGNVKRGVFLACVDDAPEKVEETDEKTDKAI
ncbi:hypothetical protein JMJ35_004010 [Cladonia borealis]|uniref:Uncharacterized protein n=1 Tax=Cladonia borealis TaxID=184061 RepID=A0AA39R3Z5_9LECA|nr:hypothetical protein JMJ35_004010 [Cladonia borealis]